MKRSLYAVLERLDDGRGILYSYSTGKFLIADSELLGCFENEEEDSQGLLVAAGMLVDEDRDEVAEQRALFEASRKNLDVLALNLAPTYACNCRCAYCYEQDKAAAKGLMTPEVEQAVYDFVQKRYQQHPFKRIEVQWYGGDPSMALGHVRRMSEWLINFCNEHGATYDALMLSNCTAMKDEDVQMLAAAKVTKMIITVDGPEDTHNLRRPAVGMDNPFQRIKEVIKLFKAAGVHVECMCNTDKVNAKLLPQLREEMKRDCGVDVVPAKLNDYAHSYGCGTFAAPNFDLFDHEEYAHAMFDLIAAGNPSAEMILGMMAPFDHFCTGQMENYFVIDAVGDLYKCDGWMGDKTRSFGNILDGGEPPALISYDPFEQRDCIQCELLPVCWGNCSWERERCGWPCHPLKHTQGKYLRLLAEVLQ